MLVEGFFEVRSERLMRHPAVDKKRSAGGRIKTFPRQYKVDVAGKHQQYLPLGVGFLLMVFVTKFCTGSMIGKIGKSYIFKFKHIAPVQQRLIYHIRRIFQSVKRHSI